MMAEFLIFVGWDGSQKKVMRQSGRRRIWNVALGTYMLVKIIRYL
jgi:hypothetical protein